MANVEERINICKKCPLYKQQTWGAVCDSNKYISKDGKEWSYFKKKDWVRGCGCLIKVFAKRPHSSCVIGLW